MSKKEKKKKNVHNIIKELMTSAFFNYYLNKMNITEFIIRILRIDIISKGSTPDKLMLLKVIRNHHRNIKEDCNCIEKQKCPEKQLTFGEFIRQQRNKKIK